MSKISDYIIQNFIVDDFFDAVNIEYKLIENEDGGKSELNWICKNEISMCISNFDNKKTDFKFLKSNESLHLSTRVDHVVFELNQNQKWDVFLIEMKTTIGSRTWNKVKGKFLASYLVTKAIAAIIDFEIENFYFYTTYEKASWGHKEEDPAEKKPHSGQLVLRSEEEWSGGRFGLNIGDERLAFKHTPIQMIRTTADVLIRKI